MLRLLLISSALVIALGCLTPLAAQDKSQLRLTTEIIDQHYCSVKADSLSLQLRLRLRYTNVGSQKLIVYKGHDLFYQTRVRNVPTGDTTPYEILFLNSRYFDEEFELIDAPSPGKVFVTLAPGAFFERELLVGIGVTSGGGVRSSDSVNTGAHTLQLIVSTWYQSPKLAERLRQQWARKGVLWFWPVVSVPLNFTIAKPAVAVSCR